MKHGVRIIAMLTVFVLLTGCSVESGKSSQDTNNPTNASGTDGQSETPGDSQPGNEKEDLVDDPYAEKIWDYEVTKILYSDKASNLIWVKARELGGETGFRAAIDKRGSIISKIYSNLSNGIFTGDYICLFDQYLNSYSGYQIYSCDGTNITDEFLSEAEEIWRVTRIDENLIVWKYEKIETYSSVKYVLRVCDSGGKLLLELDSSEYPAIGNALSADKYFPAQEQLLKELGSGFYQIGDIYIDLAGGKLYGPEQYGLKNAVNVHEGHVFSGTERDDNHKNYLKRYKGLTVYKIGIDEPLYSWETDSEMFYSVNDNGIFKTYTCGEIMRMGVDGDYFEAATEIEPYSYYDGFSGKLLARYDSASLGAERITDFNGETALTYVKGPAGGYFVTYIDQNGTFLFEPIQTRSSNAILADWRDELGAICIYYSGHDHEGEGLYLLDANGSMKPLKISDADEMALTDSDKIAVVLDGLLGLYDLSGNRLW